MKPKITLTVLLFFLIFTIFSNCGIEKNQHIGFISFEDFVCGSANKIAEVFTTNDYLYDWQLVGNKLKLDFRFRPVCGSAYGDSVISGDKTIHIFLEDSKISLATFLAFSCEVAYKCTSQGVVIIVNLNTYCLEFIF